MPAEIVGMLDSDRTIPLGIEKRRQRDRDRTFRLFYSQPDEFWFVAIQAKDGEVVTVIPVDKVPWRVSPEVLQRARKLAMSPAPSTPTARESYGKPAERTPAKVLSPYQPGPQYFELHCTGWPQQYGRIGLGRMGARHYGYSTDALVADPNFVKIVQERIARFVPPHVKVKNIFITRGPLDKYSAVFRVRWPRKWSAP